MTDHEPLVLRFDPQTVDHLGAKMYSHLPNALAELVANAYDADATNVLIRIEADSAISISDDGHGMSRDDVADKYLRIGRNRRQDSPSGLTEGGGRPVSGKKGLGKLALFGIGKRIELSTTRAHSAQATTIVLDYDDMRSAEGAYEPVEGNQPASESEHGTFIRLRQLKRSTPINAEELSVSLSRLFNYFGADFQVTVESASGESFPISRQLRLSAIQVEFEWAFPQSWRVDDEVGSARQISGVIVSAKSPLKQALRGITLYVNGRLANEPEFFGSSESSFAFSYLTGYLNVDFLDALVPDVIATDRRAIDWDTDETLLLKIQLQQLMVRLGQEWRRLRAEARKAIIDTEVGGSTEEWVSSIHAEEQESVRELVTAIESDQIDMSTTQQGDLIKLVQRVAPPHAEFVWRHLHPEIQAATSKHYVMGDYYTAVQEAIKRYVSTAKLWSNIDESDASKIVSNAFGDNGPLKVFKRYMLSNDFDVQTEKNVENGQKQISMGIVMGFRNPMAHEEVERLHSSGAFTNDDCLDALSIVSHLTRRMFDAKTDHT
ncbi:TIGR02391 family protein [Cryobacterium sp. TMT1-66-1]|uniref:TIGR02391 family protein n=1 Tax=Cryobacterium sp. TMT1-66-1 TaxID=1259242 RepID=UPI00141B4F89|nr:TIGR02391 family protein [Cryobacterium sp. TMT1-66-1]